MASLQRQVEATQTGGAGPSALSGARAQDPGSIVARNRPRGEHGKDFNLQKEMGLDTDHSLYQSIGVSFMPVWWETTRTSECDASFWFCSHLPCLQHG